MATIKVPTREEWDKADDAYCLAVEQVSVLWAKIHEDLAQLYIYRLGTNRQQAEIAWYSHRADSAQRELLKKTVERVQIIDADRFPKAKVDSRHVRQDTPSGPALADPRKADGFGRCASIPINRTGRRLRANDIATGEAQGVTVLGRVLDCLGG